MDKYLISLPTIRKRTINSNNNDKSNKKLNNIKNFNQMYLDFGQKSFGSTKTCKLCQMVYIIGDLEDEKKHNSFCSKINFDSYLPNIRQYRILESFDDDKIAKINRVGINNDKFIIDIINEVHEQLGSSIEFINNHNKDYTLLLYLHGNKNIVCGFLLLETISSNIITKLCKHSDISKIFVSKCFLNDNNGNNNASLAKFSNQASDIMLGVRLIWVKQKYRMKKIASKLIDSARINYLYGRVFTFDNIAFSQPTNDGLNFALSYCKSDYVWGY